MVQPDLLSRPALGCRQSLAGVLRQPCLHPEDDDLPEPLTCATSLATSRSSVSGGGFGRLAPPAMSCDCHIGSNENRMAVGLPTNLWRAEMRRRGFMAGLGSM